MADWLALLASIVRAIDAAPDDPATSREQRIKSVYGNLGIERPSLEIERVRRS